MVESVIALLQAGLTLWVDKNKTKYLDKFMSLKRDYYEEINKPQGKRSNARLDNITFELELLGAAFSSSVVQKDSVPKQ